MNEKYCAKEKEQARRYFLETTSNDQYKILPLHCLGNSMT